MRRKIIPYNSYLKKYAKKLRKTMTFSEVRLWNELKNGQMMGYDFDRQRMIGKYIVEFYCKDLKLALEVDGITHLEEQVAVRDSIRQKELESTGVSFLRFDALLIINKVELPLREIEEWIQLFEQKNGVGEFVKRKRLALEKRRLGKG
jgi:very-short-patch-repair endonuclease